MKPIKLIVKTNSEKYPIIIGRNLISNLPQIFRKNKKKTLLKGDIPSPINPPSGCVFRTRCPNPGIDCKGGNIEMGLIEVEPGHWVDQCCANCN